jgi:sugar lactone lactonase YvrE
MTGLFSRRRAARTAAALLAVAGGLALAGSAVAASGSPSTLFASASTVGNDGANITFTYTTPAATVSSTNWVGIYQSGQIPGEVGSTTWQYTPRASGTVTFSTASLSGVGKYQAYYLYDNGYQQLAGPVDFTVVGEPPAPGPQFARALSPHGYAALADPFGVALDASGNLWVTDTGHNRVEELSPTGRPLASFGWQRLDQPEGIAVDPAGNIWVADTGQDRVIEFSPHGLVLAVVGGTGAGDGQFDSPTALTVAPNGNVYVADQNNNRVEVLSPTGAYLSSVSVATPDGVAIDSAGNLWVSSPSYADGNAVDEFAPSGALLASFGSTQASYGALSNTAGIALADYGWISVFNPDTSFHSEFGLQSSAGAAGEDLEAPQGIAIGAAGEIFVADSGNNRIVEFTPPALSSEASR